MEKGSCSLATTSLRVYDESGHLAHDVDKGSSETSYASNSPANSSARMPISTFFIALRLFKRAFCLSDLISLLGGSEIARTSDHISSLTLDKADAAY